MERSLWRAAGAATRAAATGEWPVAVTDHRSLVTLPARFDPRYPAGSAMPSAFVPRLINPPFGDPGLYVALRHQGRAMLFDLGRIDRQPAAALLKVTHVFVSHTHMDHFIGFDHLLRIFLARDQHLDLFGPPGIIANVRGKLAGYTWNLIESYPFTLTVHEVDREHIESVHLPARTAFAPE